MMMASLVDSLGVNSVESAPPGFGIKAKQSGGRKFPSAVVIFLRLAPLVNKLGKFKVTAATLSAFEAKIEAFDDGSADQSKVA